MLWGTVKHNFMSGIIEKFGTSSHRFPNA